MPTKHRFYDLPKVNEFPDGGWTIIWHGKVERNPDVPSEQTIDVLIRSHEADQIIKIGTGQLPILKLATHWLNGRLTTTSPSIVENLVLPDIEITPETVQTIASWDKMDEHKYAIDPRVLKLSYGVSKSKCLAIQYNDDPFGIIIPASEVARFYFCNSTDLSHSAFWGDYNTNINQVVNLEKCGYDDDNDRAIIHLRPRFENNDAWTIGRIVLDQTAKAAVNEIHNSLLLKMDTEESGFFNCKVPFVGNTRWIARGINLGTKEKPRYLILQLNKCSHPFPFAELQVERDNNSLQADPETDIPPEDKKPYPSKKPDEQSDEDNKDLNSDTETNKNLDIRNLVYPSAQFDFLEGREIIKPDSKEFNQYKSVPNSPKAPDSTGLGTGQGDYSQDSANTPTQIQRKKGVGADLEMLTEAVEILANKGMDIKIRTVSQMPLSSPAKRAQWAYLDSNSKTKRTYIAIDIKTNQHHYCWIDIEQRKKGECVVGLLKHDTPIGDETLETILRNLSRLKGVWEGCRGKATEGTPIELERVFHTWDSAIRLSQTIKTKLT